MNKNRFYVGLLVAAILAVLVYASYGMVNAGKKETYHSVAVIVDDSSSDRWTAFKEALLFCKEGDFINPIRAKPQ